MNNKLLLTFLLSLFLLVPVFSQDKDSTYTDTTKTDTDEEWESAGSGHEYSDKWDDIGSHMFDFKIKGVPTISLNFGASKMKLKSIGQNFTDPGMLELKLGYTTEKSFAGSDDVIKYKFNYFHISNFTPDLEGKNTSTDLNSNSWRLGLGEASGYGYEFGGGFSIIPYHAISFDWTKMDMKSTPVSALDQNTTDLFNKDIRFGNSFQGGIQIKFLHSLAIDASYERSIVYPRHLFWKWGMGMVIEGAGLGLVNLFVDKVLDSSPVAAPIVNFLLKNALSYGLYELKQDKMNWPFETVAPLTFRSV